MPYYNSPSDLTQRITCNKLRILKLVITVGSDTDILVIAEKNAIYMAQGGLITEAKRLQVVHSQKGLIVVMLPKDTNPPAYKSMYNNVPSRWFTRQFIREPSPH